MAWPPSPTPFSDSLQGMNSDSDGVQVIETKILNDKEWIESLDSKERQSFESNLVSFEELEDKKVVCTSCFTQGNHKQKVRPKTIFFFELIGQGTLKLCSNYFLLHRDSLLGIHI